LGMIGRRAESAAPILAGQIDLEYGERASEIAIDALGRIGPPAQIAAPVLFQALAMPWKEHELECRPRVRLAAAVALRRTGADTGPTVPVLISLLSIEETPVFHSRFVGRRLAADIRRDAAAALGELGGSARDAIPALTSLLQDDFITVREAAELAIHRVYANRDDR
jgi:HEAT repeat protein